MGSHYLRIQRTRRGTKTFGCALLVLSALSIESARSAEAPQSQALAENNALHLIQLGTPPDYSRITNNGHFAFSTFLGDTPRGANDNKAVFASHGGPLEDILHEGATVPDGSGTFNDMVVLAHSEQEHIFGYAIINRPGETSGSENGIFVSHNQSLDVFARSGDTSPDGNGRFSQPAFFRSTNSSGSATLTAILDNTANGFFDNRVLLQWKDSNLSVLARSGMLDTEGNGAAASFGHTHINDQGTIVTRINLRSTALDSLDDEGLFRVDNSGLIRVVREGDIAPDGQNRIFIEREQFALNNAGAVAFNARLYAQGNQFFGTQAILVHDRGQTTEVVKAGDASPSANGTFSGFSAPLLNDSGDVFFSAVIEESQSPANAPSQNLRLPSLASPELDNFADINLPQRVHGIYRAHGDQLTEIVRTGDPTPEGRDEFLGLTALHANDAGVVAFSGFYRESAVSNENGIYLGDGIDTVKVARIGDQLGGREIYSIRVLQEPDTGASSLNRHGELLLDVGTTSDQGAESGVYRFVPELHWRGNGSGEWDTSTDINENARTNWTLSLIPDAVHDVLIDPELAVTVLGPNSDTHVKSLVVGSGAGAAVLQLANGTIEAKQGVSIAMNGVLAGSGELVGQVAVAGTLSPGNSIGKIAIDGDLSLDDTARTLIEIDYLRDIESSDRIDATGFVELGGLLEIHLLNWSFENSPREFLIFSANGLQGEFAEITVFDASHLSARFHNDGQRFFVSVSAVPLPPAAWLFTTGVLTILGWRRKSF